MTKSLKARGHLLSSTENQLNFLNNGIFASGECDTFQKHLEKQEIGSAHAFLKIKFPNKLNIWEMQNKKLIENYNKFILDFDDKMIIEKMEYDQNILFARLRIYGRSWIENNKKNKVFPINQDLPKKHPSLKRLTY